MISDRDHFTDLQDQEQIIPALARLQVERMKQ